MMKPAAMPATATTTTAISQMYSGIGFPFLAFEFKQKRCIGVPEIKKMPGINTWHERSAWNDKGMQYATVYIEKHRTFDANTLKLLP